MYVGVERCYPDNSIDTCFWQPRRYLQRRRRGVRAYIVVDLPRVTVALLDRSHTRRRSPRQQALTASDLRNSV